VLFLDYDGTLTPLVEYRNRAIPSPELLRVLQTLQSDARNLVVVISGRDCATLERWLGVSGCLLVAEHGAWLRPPPGTAWQPAYPEVRDDWKGTVRPLLEQVVARTPGSLLEEKDYSLVWHYRLADPEFGLWQARELHSQLQSLLAGTALRVQSGHKVVEVKWADLHKGKTAAQILTDTAPADFVLAIGDDQTDEDLFAVIPPEQWTIKVGAGTSAARFMLPDPVAVLALLRDLGSARP
jgi:trehalose 6-phosphate synthase/phosphatase